MNASPNNWKSGTPAARAAARIRGTQTEKNAGFDVARRVDPEAVDLDSADPVGEDVREPVRTSACSVKRSSRPKKSPSSKHAGGHELKSMLPRLW